MTSSFPHIVRPSPAAQVPVVVSVPHSGQDIPDDEMGLYAIGVQQLLGDGDLYVDELYAGAEVHGATVISTPVSRFVVDLNRLEDDLSPLSAAGATPRRGPGYYGDRGVLWAVTTHGEPIYRRPLTPHEVERRIRRWHRPYHEALATELERLRREFGFAILLDAHSMPSRATRLHPDRAGATRADVVPGDLMGSSCAPALRAAVSKFWRERDYSCAPNRPYRGGGIVRTHGRPARGIHAIQIELNRALYMDEATLERSPGMAALAVDCLAFVERIARLRLEAEQRLT